MAKKRIPKYGLIDILRAILAHNLAKYQYFSMRPGLFEKFHQIPYSMQFTFPYIIQICHTDMPWLKIVFSKVKGLDPS